MDNKEPLSALLARYLRAISDVDYTILKEITNPTFCIKVPGPSFMDITEDVHGPDASCRWAQRVHDECGVLSFQIRRYFENGCEIMANGDLVIVRSRGTFASLCAIHAMIEADKISSFQLLFDTAALQQFRSHCPDGYR